ncbi:hypothetical protein D3C87_2175840 [compost metagenome]
MAEDVWADAERNLGEMDLLDLHYRLPSHLLRAAFPGTDGDAAPRIYLSAEPAV